MGRYALYEKIASGGMASVHLGRLLGQVGFSRAVAIKRLHPHYATDAEFVSMFLDEARLAARIRHPNVVPTLDVVAADGELFVVMEYVQGESLNRLLGGVVAAGSYVPPRIVSAVMSDLLHGLHAAHEAKNENGESLGIVHRDVSPHNVIVGIDGTARVLDFGIAKAVSRLQTTREGQLKGKIAYMAPEQVEGGKVDPRSDIYAASVVLWETLTGTRLFTADSEAALMAKVHAAVIRPPSECMKEAALRELSVVTQETLDALVMKGLSRSPADRFESARAMATALEECLPPAPRAQVGAWVEEMAQGALLQRAESLAQIESDVSLTPMPKPMELLREIRSSPASAPSGPSLPDDSSSETAVDKAVQRRRESANPPEVTPAGGSYPKVPSTAPNMAVPPTLHPPVIAPRTRWAALAALGVVVAGALGAIYALRSKPDTTAPATGSVSAEHATPRALTDFPPPSSPNLDALAAYRAGLQAMRDGSFDAALVSFGRATTLDPGLAAAHLRKSMADSLFSADEMVTRATFMKAVQLRTTLSDRDQALLDAFQPLLQSDPSDLGEAEKRLGKVVERFDDAEMWFYLGFVRHSAGHLADARAAFEHAMALDPKFALALAYDGGARAYLGDLDGARSVLDQCISSSPTGTDCLWFRAQLNEQAGECAREETDAKLWIARDPDDFYGYQFLAQALTAQGRPKETVHAALEQKWAKLAPEGRQWRSAVDQARLEALGGDFEHAEARLRELADSPNVSDPGETTHAIPAALLVGIYMETGQPARAQRLADSYLKQNEAWVQPAMADDATISDDPIPVMLGTLERLGAMSPHEVEAKRTQWLDLWSGKTRGAYTNYLWIYGFARMAESHEDVQAAFTALPKFQPLPSFAPQSMAMGYVGRAFLLAGRVDEALPLLRKATASCATLMEPVDHTRAFYDLGQALEQKSDADGACSAYATVVRRWGDAKPRSRTAQLALGRTAALHCPPVTKEK